MIPNNELRLFISSTFRDMGEEREHLVKKVFPEIRALCRERGVTFTEIDLRWGITAEEAERQGIIKICLEEIDRCRPYFIGILGERYGWIPPEEEVSQVADDFPTLHPPGSDGRKPEPMSITEMEIYHGALLNPAMADHVFFYMRHPDATPPEHTDTDPDPIRRLARLKDLIRASSFPVREDFQTVSELGEWIKHDLLAVIEREFPESAVPSPLETERYRHHAFAQSRIKGYVENRESVEQFRSWLSDSNPPLVISGESGLGKSSLTAYLVELFREENPNGLAIEHYVGISDQGGTAYSVMRHVVEEIRERFPIEVEVPASPSELEKSFPNWLFLAEHHAKAEGVPVLILVDALNQLDDVGTELAWLPTTIPSGIHLMVSSTPGKADDRLREREWSRLEVHPLSDRLMRREIVKRYLSAYRKEISEEQMERLIADQNASSPLYLKVVAEELRLHGEHETLGGIIDYFRNVDSLLDLFDKVLARLEGDFGRTVVADVLCNISLSRSGLNESELLDLTNLNRLNLSWVLQALDYHLIRRDGRRNFFHDYLRRAVRDRYLRDDQTARKYSERLAHYFEQAPISPRSTLEILNSLERLNNREEIEQVLTNIPRLVDLWQVSERNEMLRLWSSTEPETVASALQSSYDIWKVTATPEECAEGLKCIEGVAREVGAWNVSRLLMIERLALLRTLGDKKEEAWALGRLAAMELNSGNVEEAERLSFELESIAQQLNDATRHGWALGVRGLVYSNQGRYEDALDCFRGWESIAREGNDIQGIGSAKMNQGTVHIRRSEFDLAKACYEENELLVRRLGNRAQLINNHLTRGILHNDLGEFEMAIAQFKQAESIALELGSRYEYAIALTNRGVVHFQRSEYDEAITCYETSAEIQGKLGEIQGRGIALGNTGNVYLATGEYSRALEMYHRALELHQQTGFRYGVTYWLEGITSVVVEILERGAPAPESLKSAAGIQPDHSEEEGRDLLLNYGREQGEKTSELSQQLSKPDTLHSSSVLLARLDILSGNPERALQRLDESFHDNLIHHQRAELHYYQWKILTHPTANTTTPSHNEKIQHHHTETLRWYREAYEKTGVEEYRRRVEEVGG